MSATRYRLVPENELRQEPPEPSEPKWRFRWAIFVGLPVVIAAILFLLNGINPSFEIEDLMDWFGVIKQNRYARMMCLMVVCIAALLIVKLFRNHSD